MNSNVFKSYTKPTSNENVLFWESNFWTYEVTKDELLLLIPYLGKVKRSDLELFPGLVILDIKYANINEKDIEEINLDDLDKMSAYAKVILMTEKNINSLTRSQRNNVDIFDYERVQG